MSRRTCGWYKFAHRTVKRAKVQRPKRRGCSLYIHSGFPPGRHGSTITVMQMKHYMRTSCALHKLSFFRVQTRWSIVMSKDNDPNVMSVDESATNPTPVATRVNAFESKLDSLASSMPKMSNSFFLGLFNSKWP